MKRLEVRFRPEALSDLEDIYRWVYRASSNPIIAERFTMRIVARCLKIGDAPRSGRPRDDLALGR
jgi:toxin ParE1/3/4